MTRLNFRFIPRDAGDFDVCAGPPRPARVPRPEPAESEPANDSSADSGPLPEPAPTAKG